MEWQQGDGSGAGGGPEPEPVVPGSPDALSARDASGNSNTLRAPAPQTEPQRDARLSGFAPEGEWDACPPGPELAAVLAAVAGPEWRCPDAEPEEIIGVLRRLAALESWASAAKLGVIRELIRRDDAPVPPATRHGDLPDHWSDSLSHELALAFAVSAQSAEKTMLTAWELGARLPGVAALHADGTLAYAKVRLIVETFQWLSDEDAAKAEALLLPQLTGTTGKTYGQIVNLANRIANQVDPGLAERRRQAAVKHASRVQMFREESGAAALCGRDLPTDETAAADANVTARAAEYKDSGAFPDAGLDQLRATAYLDLINGVPVETRIAFAQLGTDTPEPETAPETEAPPDDDGPNDRGSDGGEPPSGEDPDGGLGRSGGGGHGGSGDNSPGKPWGEHSPGEGETPSPVGNGSASLGAGNQPTPPAFRRHQGTRLVLTDLTVPLVTLLGLADRPGEAHRLGVLDPELCRDLAALAVASQHSRVCITVTDTDGIAIGHGCGRSRKRVGPTPGQSHPGAPPSPVALPARLNLTITADRLSAMLPRTPRAPGKSSMRASPAWMLARHDADGAAGSASRRARGTPGDPDWCGTWTLTVPGDRELAVLIDPVPTDECDHRYESHGYQPNDTLRHLIQVRDYTCTFPPCSRHASESDFEHAQPYDKGGRTCACNAGARSRKCHRVKQSPGWKVIQPKPGWHAWTTPSGRTYVQSPYRYPV
jgi:hypothetical protein